MQGKYVISIVTGVVGCKSQFGLFASFSKTPGRLGYDVAILMADKRTSSQSMTLRGEMFRSVRCTETRPRQNY